MTQTAEDIRADLDAARAELLAALDGITQEEFVRRPPASATGDDVDAEAEGDGEQHWSARDVLWHIGLLEDWFRRMVDQARGGRPIVAYDPRRRPAHMNTPDLLVEWLRQTRHATLVLLDKLDEADLDREFTLPEGEVRTPRRLLAHLARHDREHAEQVRALRAMAAGSEGA